MLFPYLNGEDLNSRPDQSPSRWVINFHDWPLDAEHDNPKDPKGPPYAADYPEVLRIVIEKVKDERQTKSFSKSAREKWWLYERWRPEFYSTIAGMDRVLIRARVSNLNSIAFVPSGIVVSEQTVVFASDDYRLFALLQSSIHTEWLNYHASSMRMDVRYTPSDCFETFPFPPSPLAPLPEGEGDKSGDESGELIGDKTVGWRYFEHRQRIMLDRQEGLTKTYNRFHDPDETAADIQTLRDLHRDMDHAVAAAYGWTDLLPSPSGRGAGGEGLGHDFHTTKQGIRYTLSEPARREILDRLLELNHQRYAAEVKAGLHDKKKGKTGKKGTGRNKKKGEVDQGELL